MNTPKFGPGGNCERFYAEGHKHTFEAPAFVAANGLSVYEYQGGNGLRAGDAAFEKIGDAARESGIAVSLHAPYYISLSGVEPETRLKSIEYIKQSVNAAKLLGAHTIVIHTGSASKITREEAMSLCADTVSRALGELESELVSSGIILGLETMGKQNQLGTLDEVIKLCKISPLLSPVVDFGHLNARDGGGVFVSADDYRHVFDRIAAALGDEKAINLHCHFSKIEYTAGGEKKHLTFEDTVYGPEFAPLAQAIARDKLAPTIICESAGTMTDDAIKMRDLYRIALTESGD